MDARTARSYLEVGMAKLLENEAQWDRREDYVNGDQDLPFAPPGVSREYLELREKAPLNLLDLIINAPVQRLRVDNFRTGRSADVDEKLWLDVWQHNRLDQRQKIVYRQAEVHGRGIMSVSADRSRRERPRVRVESSKRVWIQGDPEDPFKPLFAVKKVIVSTSTSSGLLLPDGTPWAAGSLVRWFVYDKDGWARFDAATAGSPPALPDETGEHGFGTVPFVPFDVALDADGIPHSPMERLMPAQDAFNTIRFFALLAVQFAGARQRGVTGVDPVVRDQNGNPIYQKNPDGSVKLDANGQPIPLLIDLGALNSDRWLMFPGTETRVWDLEESNLGNYVQLMGEFLGQMFAAAQIPPQYLLNRLANISGDALNAAEGTMKALIADLKTSFGESHEQVMRLANIARGSTEDDQESEVVWGEDEAQTFAQIIDGIVKLVGIGFPTEAAFEMIPGATSQKVGRWMKLVKAEQDQVNARVINQIESDLNAVEDGTLDEDEDGIPAQ